MSIFLQKLIIETPWACAFTTKIGRSSMESDQFRCEPLASPVPVCEVCWDYGSIDRESRRFDGTRRYRSSRKQYDRVDEGEASCSLCTEENLSSHLKMIVEFFFLAPPRPPLPYTANQQKCNYRPFVWYLLGTRETVTCMRTPWHLRCRKTLTVVPPLGWSQTRIDSVKTIW